MSLGKSVRYVVAGSAEELKEALVQTVATSFRVFKGSIKVANGSLGSNKQAAEMRPYMSSGVGEKRK